MADDMEIIEHASTPRTKILIVGSVVGASVGLLGAFLLVQSMEKQDRELRITTGEGLRLGLIVLTLLRQVAGLPDTKKA
jgi:hypothetical protein